MKIEKKKDDKDKERKIEEEAEKMQIEKKEDMDKVKEEKTEEEDKYKKELVMEVNCETTAAELMFWGKEKIKKAYATVTKPGRFQYKETVWTNVPPYRFSHYDLTLSKRKVLEMNSYIEENPEDTYNFVVGTCLETKRLAEASGLTFIELKVRPEVRAKELTLEGRNKMKQQPAKRKQAVKTGQQPVKMKQQPKKTRMQHLLEECVEVIIKQEVDLDEVNQHD